MKKIILIIGCLVLSVMLLFIFLASLGGLFAEDKQLGTAIPLLAGSVFGFLLVFAIAKKHIFSHEDSKTTHQSENENTVNNEKLYTYEDIVRGAVMSSDFINPIFKEKVIEFQLPLKKYDLINDKDIDFCNEDKFLDSHEKKELGLDINKEYQRSLSIVLTERAPNYGKASSRRVLVYASHKASCIDKMQDEIIRAQKLKIVSMKASPVGDERDCEWCLSMKDKIVPVSLDFVNNVLSNCRCDYPRLVIKPQINI